VPEPGEGDTLADRDRQVSFSGGLDDADSLVTGDQEVLGLDRPLAARGVDVGVAQPAGLDAHQDLARARFGDREVTDLEGRAECGDDCSLHCSLLE
jgi:hypothetical protein